MHTLSIHRDTADEIGHLLAIAAEADRFVEGITLDMETPANKPLVDAVFALRRLREKRRSLEAIARQEAPCRSCRCGRDA